MRRRGLTIVIIAVVAAALVGTWTVAYRAGESDGRTKVSTDRSIFQTRIAGAPQAGASGAGPNAAAGGNPGAVSGAAGTRGPGGGSAVAVGASGTPGAGRVTGTGTGTASSLTGRVTKVDGSTLSVQQTDSSTVSVTTNADTAIRKLVAGAISDLKAGDVVTVDGSKTGDTGFSAKSVTSLGSAAGAGGGRPPGAPTGGAPGLVGQIKSVDGATIMLQGFDGTTTAVTTTPATVIRTQQAGTLSDIKTGDMLLIQGDKTSDTAFLARTITNQGASG